MHFSSNSVMASSVAIFSSHNVPHFIDQNYKIALNQSIEALLISQRNPNSKSSSPFISSFQDLIQAKVDPPLETIWVLASLTFNNSTPSKIEPLDQIIAIKDLFQLIASCSASCNSVKSIVLVAPVIYLLHNFILDLKSLQPGSKKEKKVKREIKNLVDSIIGFINVCSDGFDVDSYSLESLIRPLDELISFWIVDNGSQNKNVEFLRVFFPLLSDSIVARASVEGCGIVEIVGFVIAEAFLLKLCWTIQEEDFGEKAQNELKFWIVGSITGFWNSYFYVNLASMLLEPVLPITSLMNVEHEEGLRKNLFDALVLVEYSFFTPENLGKLSTKHAKSINLTRLMLTDKAIDFFRKRGEQSKVVSYLNAFTSSTLPSQLMKCIRNEIGDAFDTNGPNGSSPRAFLRWMLKIENGGIKIFDDNMSKYRAKLISSDFEEEFEQLANREEANKQDSDLLFYIDNKGQEDENMKESMSAAFMDAAHSMESAEQGGKKRKKRKNGENPKKVKFVKYNS